MPATGQLRRHKAVSRQGLCRQCRAGIGSVVKGQYVAETIKVATGRERFRGGGFVGVVPGRSEADEPQLPIAHREHRVSGSPMAFQFVPEDRVTMNRRVCKKAQSAVPHHRFTNAVRDGAPAELSSGGRSRGCCLAMRVLAIIIIRRLRASACFGRLSNTIRARSHRSDIPRYAIGGTAPYGSDVGDVR